MRSQGLAFFFHFFWMLCTTGAKFIKQSTRDVYDATVLTTPGETVASPGYYTGGYSNHEKEHWLIYAPEGERILLNFLFFRLENSEECEADYVYIIDGDYSEGEILGSACGRTRPDYIVSNTNQLHVIFETDYSDVARGFRFRYFFFSNACNGGASVTLPTRHNSESCGRTATRNKRDQGVEKLVRRAGHPEEADEVSWLVRRIFGGSESEHGEWPWLVAVNAWPSDAHYCGGTLIHTEWVLTAAHCFVDKENTELKPENYILHVGEHSILEETETTVHSRHPEKIFIHPDYDTVSMKYDFALLKMKNPVPLSDYVGLVCLPTEGEEFTGSCVAAGWGTTDLEEYNGRVRHVDLPIVSNSECAQIHAKEEGWSEEDITADMMCAGGADNKDTCSGDSGGPLVCMKEGVYVFAGVTSFGLDCGKEGLPGVSGRVTYALPWIRKTIAEHNLPSR